MFTAGEDNLGTGPTVDRRLALRLFVSSVFGLAGATLCYFLMRRTSAGQQFDSAAYRGSLPINPAILGGNELNRITADSLVGVLVLLLVIGLVRRRLLLGVAAAVAAGLAVVITDLLKDDVFTHPFFTRQVPLVGDTFPSGHTATAVACAMALMLVWSARWRSPVGVIAGAYGWITAIQAQTTSSHHPSDVIGAAFLSFAVVAAVAGLLAWFRPVDKTESRFFLPCQAVFGLVAVAAAATTVWGLTKVVGQLPAGTGSDHDTATVLRDAFITGVALSVTVVVGVLMTLLALVRGSDFASKPGRRPS